MQYLTRKNLKYTFQKVSHKYAESSIGNAWYTILFALRVLMLYFVMGGIGCDAMPHFLYYVATGNFLYELFKDFCAQCLETNKKRQSIAFKWDIRKYYLLYQGVIFCFYLPVLLVLTFVSQVNVLKFIIFFSAGLAVFVFWLYHLAAILAYVSEKSPELKIILKLGLSYLFFLTPVFWSPDYASSKAKVILSMLNPLAYMLDIPRYAIMDLKIERLGITAIIVAITYFVARYINWQDHGKELETLT